MKHLTGPFLETYLLSHLLLSTFKMQISSSIKMLIENLDSESNFLFIFFSKQKCLGKECVCQK